MKTYTALFTIFLIGVAALSYGGVRVINNYTLIRLTRRDFIAATIASGEVTKLRSSNEGFAQRVVELTDAVMVELDK